MKLMNKFLAPLVAVFVCGCAGQPTTSMSAANGTPATVPPAAAPAAAGSSAAGAPTQATAPQTTDQLIANAKREGYTVVNQNGDEVLCRTQFRTGSHIVKDTYCMTPAEYEQLRQQTQRGLVNTMTASPLKSFK
jgi:hypothetical protein